MIALAFCPLRYIGEPTKLLYFLIIPEIKYKNNDENIKFN